MSIEARRSYYESRDPLKAKVVQERAAKNRPISHFHTIHKEDEIEENEANNRALDIEADTRRVEEGIANLAKDVEALMLDAERRLRKAEEDAMIEAERVYDLSFLSEESMGVREVKTLTGKDFFEADALSNNIMTSRKKKSSPSKLSVVDVEGNGYEGNRFVMKDGKEMAVIMDTSKRAHMTNGSMKTFYEYSRLVSPRTDLETFGMVNFDNEDARCAISIKSDKPISSLEIRTESDKVKVENVYVSPDGKSFQEVADRETEINSRRRQYDKKEKGYTYGSGLIAFPQTEHIKIVLSSSETRDDDIVFLKGGSL